KDAVDEPARRRVARQAGAEQPEAPTLLVLDPVVVANRVSDSRTALGPPFLGDALGPVGAQHPMPVAAPDEAERRIVGQDPIRLDRLRRPEQPDRARGFAKSPHPNPPPLA